MRLEIAGRKDIRKARESLLAMATINQTKRIDTEGIMIIERVKNPIEEKVIDILVEIVTDTKMSIRMEIETEMTRESTETILIMDTQKGQTFVILL